MKMKVLRKKMYYLDFFVLTKSLQLLSPPLSEVVITETIKVIDISNEYWIINYNFFSRERIKSAPIKAFVKQALTNKN